MRKCSAVLFGLLVLALLGCGKQAPGGATPKSNPAAAQAGIESAEAWLALVDDGSFPKSWEEAAAYFKSATSQADWEKAVRAVRTPLGKVVSRKVKSQQYATSLPGAPDGEYVVVEYDTTFEKKANAVETITPMLDKDGKWRVSGYYIK
ncbi:MAG: hypothetical protein A2W31_03875 [Planctomycetes bacterium RBG_16_64_10]|nr:MAG: hypothetical protein A2W31_03875 [Planctomycetes bacterium RBG_16_64_10]